MSRAARVMSTLTKIVGGFIALVVLSYFAVNLVGLGRGWIQRGQLADEFAEQAAPLMPVLRDEQASVADLAGREPDRVWIEQVCTFGHSDSGWMINNYREECSLRAVSAWQVESPEAGRGLLPATPWLHPFGAQECEEVGSLDDEKTHVVLAVAGRAADEDCGPANGYDTATRTIDGDSRALPSDSSWLLAVHETGPLVDANIGCVHWSVLFCENPFTDHAWADID